MHTIIVKSTQIFNLVKLQICFKNVNLVQRRILKYKTITWRP